jgi:hypothetical protein
MPLVSSNAMLLQRKVCDKLAITKNVVWRNFPVLLLFSLGIIML